MLLRVGLVLGAALILTIGTVMAVKVAKIDIKDFKQRTGPKFMMMALAANLLFIVIVDLLLRLLDRRNLLELGLDFRGWDVLYCVNVFLITILIALLFMRGLKYPTRWAGGTFISKGEGLSFLLSFLVLFVAALQEEIMFRGYLGFVFHEIDFVRAMLLSTVIFTVWHFIGNKVTVFQTVDWFVGGLLLFFVYYASGSIWVAAVAHFSRNLTNVLIFNIANKHSLLAWERPITPGHKTLYVVTCSLVLASLTIYFY